MIANLVTIIANFLTMVVVFFCINEKTQKKIEVWHAICNEIWQIEQKFKSILLWHRKVILE